MIVGIRPFSYQIRVLPQLDTLFSSEKILIKQLENRCLTLGLFGKLAAIHYAFYLTFATSKMIGLDDQNMRVQA